MGASLQSGHPSSDLSIHSAPSPQGAQRGPALQAPSLCQLRTAAQSLSPQSLYSAPGRGWAGISGWVSREGGSSLINWGRHGAGTPARGPPGPGALPVCAPPGPDPLYDPQGGDSRWEGELGWAQSRVDRARDRAEGAAPLPSPPPTAPGRPSRGGGRMSSWGRRVASPALEPPPSPRSRVVPETAARRAEQ